jgi:mannose-1-phosphate guanylyltransferase
MLHAVIMAGGAGTRFWPISRAATPKQLLQLTGVRTMLQATVDRLAELVPASRTLIVTNQRLVEAIEQQLPELPRANIVGEPCKRDTAPCIGLAAQLVSRDDPDATLVVMPSDHSIEPPETFQAALAMAVELVNSRPKQIVTFGIRPTYPAETFGYIERGEPLATDEPAAEIMPVYAVTKFREKPARSIAEEYLAAGNFFWNSGIFVWKARTVLDALAKYEPEMSSRLQTIAAAMGQASYPTTLDREFTAIRGKSIDFAVLEHYRDVAVIEAPFEWDDVGSWQALARSVGDDAQENTVHGKHIGVRTRGSIIYSSDDHLIATLGIHDCIVVHTPDATLVASKHEEEAIREIVNVLEERNWAEYL